MTATPARKLFTESFSGLGMGCLVGLILGMSITSVVATFAAALAALLGAYLGLSNKDDAAEHSGRSLRIGVFGLACAAGILCGTMLRTHDTLGVPVKDRVKAWTEAGASQEMAVRYVALEKLGVMPPGAVMIDKPSNPGTGLMSVTADECTDLASGRFESTTKRVESMMSAGKKWRELALSMENLDDKHRALIVEASYQLACGVTPS